MVIQEKTLAPNIKYKYISIIIVMDTYTDCTIALFIRGKFNSLCTNGRRIRQNTKSSRYSEGHHKADKWDRLFMG